MKDIRQVIRRKQAQQAQLAKEIKLLEQAEEKLREVASLLADSDEEDENPVLGDEEEELAEPKNPASKAASASGGNEAGAPNPEPAGPPRPLALRWP